MARREALNPTSDALARNNGKRACNRRGEDRNFCLRAGRSVRTRPVAAKGHFALDASARL